MVRKKKQPIEDLPEEQNEFKQDLRIGSKFWQARSKHGRDLIFGSPDIMWQAANEYFEWNHDNPLYEEKVFHTNGIVTRTDIAKMRAMTIQGLCTFLGIGLRTWYEYKNREDFSQVMEAIEQVIWQQKFTGAAADFLNPNIIARELGLKDSIANEHTGLDGGPIKTETVVIPSDPIEASKAYQDMIKNS